ncbi:MAG: TMEM143 family protein [Halioglobus sp.]
MSELPLLRFIPFRRSDLVQLCSEQGSLEEHRHQQFLLAREKLERHFRNEFHDIKQTLKDVYAPLDPDADTRATTKLDTQTPSSDLQGMLADVLERANYEQVTDKGLQRALKSSSLFQVRLFVDLDDFEEVLLYTRGATEREETLRELFGLWRRKVRFTNYDRVLLYIRLKDDVDADSTLGDCQPGSTVLRLFQNVPEADLEMLFPNIRVGMRTLDKLMVGVPALVSGGLVLTTKMGTTLLLLGSLLGFWLGLSSEPVQLDKAAFIVLSAGTVALVGYLWKQYSNFRNRKLKYTQALTENLYFKLLDNNAGALFRILDDAEESECKESLLAYHFLLVKDGPVSAQELDESIETWFAQTLQCKIDFEIDDALDKLLKLNLATKTNDQWQAVIEATT